MTTKTIQYSWMSWIAQVDPDFHKESVRRVEYEFSARGLPIEPTGDDSEYENGMRVFRANPRSRGPYSQDDVAENGVTWGDLGITWDGDDVTWED